MNKKSEPEAETPLESSEESPEAEELVISEIEAQLKRLSENPEAKELITKFDKVVKDFSLQELLERDSKLIEEVKIANKERDEYLSLLQKFKADFENYKKRTEKQNEHIVQRSSDRIISKLFEPVEDLSRAIAFASEHQEGTVPLEGISIVYNKLMRLLEDEAVELIAPSPGDTFDPHYHEAICTDPSGNSDPEAVVHVVEKGYKIKGKVVRAAKVMVSTEASEEK